jgi:cobalt-zinc-cadmium efflux system outer membrane protein
MMKFNSHSVPCFRSLFSSGLLACAMLLWPLLAYSQADVPSPAPIRYSLKQLTALALANNRGLQAASDQVTAARSSIETARAFPNPELEMVRGSIKSRLPGVVEGDSGAVWVSQRIDYPWVRDARISAADAGAEAARAGQKLSRNELLARLRYRFYEMLRQEAELKATQEDELTMQQIAYRIKLKVETGESPRFEAIKADTEVLSAHKLVQTAELRIHQTRSSLRQLVGTTLSPNFEVVGSLEDDSDLLPLEVLRNEVLERSPELARNRALTRQAESQRNYEQHLRWPTLAIKGGYDQTPDSRDNRVGVVFTLPLWDRRSGPVAEAEARLAKARNEEAQNAFVLQQNLETSWQQWQIANAQVTALQSGIVKQAGEALRVAEAAYRYGERGILEYLDAQRVYRAARNELIAARFDRQVAIIEIDRLRAAQDASNEASKGSFND